jgi:Cu-Zn family superoxide dismutase
MKIIASLAFVSLFAVPALADKTKPVTVSISDAKGKSVGTATLTADSKGKGVKIALDVKGLAPGQHAIHIHETAKCDAPDFKSAGGHFNPDHKQHGMENKQGPHAGDMPNFVVDSKGISKAQVQDPNITLDDGAHGVFANGGTALVIHAKADDMKTDPSGAAGDRIACGIIKK